MAGSIAVPSALPLHPLLTRRPLLEQNLLSKEDQQ